jgi:hypothetical protein
MMVVFLSLPSVRWDRLKEKQIKLITFELKNDINKTSLEKKMNERRKRSAARSCDDEWKWKKRFSITQADHMRIENDAHIFFMELAPSLFSVFSLLVFIDVALSYTSCVRLHIFLSLN